MTTVEIDESLMREVVGAALLERIDKQGRDSLIMGAIQHLLSPDPSESGGYESTTSRVGKLYAEAVAQAASKLAAEMLRAEPAKSKLEEIVIMAMQEFVACDTKKAASAMAISLREALQDYDYSR